MVNSNTSYSVSFWFIIIVRLWQSSCCTTNLYGFLNYILNTSLDKIFKKKLTLENDIFYHDKANKESEEIEKFYNISPFPNYSQDNSKRDTLLRGEKNLFFKNLKNFIGYNKKVIEVGSGTCQLSMYLALETNNEIFALDTTINSLKIARDFKFKNGIDNVHLIKANIFDEIFFDEVFDIVCCSGVLHHTYNPQKGFNIICRNLKKNGYIIIGLYNKIGRLRTFIRQKLYKIFGKRIIKILDPHLRKMPTNSKDRESAWIRDQYVHPRESSHTFDEVLKWFSDNNIKFINSVPSCEINYENYNFFEEKTTASYFQRIFQQISMIFSPLGGEGGLFLFIGKKVK